MWQYIFLTLRRQRGRSGLAGGGFLVAACALILLSATTQTTVLQARQTISQHWRSTYDLVVLPAQTPLPATNIIPADLFQSYDGGISIQQYEQIKALPGVAVAAPIAPIGNALLPSSSLQLGPTRPASGFYQLSWTLTAFNGIQHLVEHHSTLLSYIDASPPFPDYSSQTLDAFDTLGIHNIQVALYGRYEAAIPTVGTFRLAAIDPVAENQLVHLNQSIVSGRPLPEQQTLHPDPQYPNIFVGGAPGQSGTIPNYEVPLLFNTQLPGSVALHVSLSRFNTDTTDPNQIAARGGRSYLEHLPMQTLFAGDVPFALNTTHFFVPGRALGWDGHSWQVQQSKYVGTGPQYTDPPGPLLTLVSSPSGLTYHRVLPPTGQTSSAYALVPGSTQSVSDSAIPLDIAIGEQNQNLAPPSPEVSFRTLTPFVEMTFPRFDRVPKAEIY
ncbi:MAG: hypothetical protein M3Z24_17250 [Chloroflexota bacterium]|nr:hypothetical protein [Chloroflexota bacterium]